MEHSNLMTTDNPTHIDPYLDPVAYLADLGLESELVAVISCLDEAA